MLAPWVVVNARTFHNTNFMDLAKPNGDDIAERTIVQMRCKRRRPGDAWRLGFIIVRPLFDFEALL
jgi:hypothetical protein